MSNTTGAKGSTVEVPINLEGAAEVGSINIVLTYDANLLSAEDVEAGALGKNALIASNTANDGAVIIVLADSSGISGDGAVAIVAFEVIGDAGSTSPLTLEGVSVNNVELVEIITTTESGTFKVAEEDGATFFHKTLSFRKRSSDKTFLHCKNLFLEAKRIDVKVNKFKTENLLWQKEEE